MTSMRCAWQFKLLFMCIFSVFLQDEAQLLYNGPLFVFMSVENQRVVVSGGRPADIHSSV